MKKLTKKDVKEFRTLVYDFFAREGRELPWRPAPENLTSSEPRYGTGPAPVKIKKDGTVDPYKILVSEVMLQQTQVDRVIPFYTTFIERLPTIADLANTSLKQVLALWQGLGYNRRAKFLHQTAKQVIKNHGGTIPANVEELEKLPGIGPATARSIAVFAYNKPIAFIETNIRSVFLHHFFPGKENVPDSNILPLIEQTFDTENPRAWYSALMDYGGVIKKQHSNPSRRSKHHTKQSAFKGSNRQVRGAVIRALVKSGAQDIAELTTETGFAKKRIIEVVNQLKEEDFIKQKKRKIVLKS